jgi:alkanesulfonate monooxygenase SsuD/methylene tetrahydromethanopterin reductase-like flavin-dependent oxidoreductase (luciferase family)
MHAGLFMMPTHPPERSLYDGQQWDLQLLRWADDLGFTEAWLGEHFTSPWEPNPSPDILLAQALLQTRQIKLAPGAHLLPYHHPAELACRVAFMDHLAQGRYMLGIGASGLPGDWQLFNVDGMAGENRRMMAESLDIMLKLWESDGGLDYEGTYWTVHQPEPNPPAIQNHLKPFQKPHPPIGIAGFTPHSDSLKLAGERGFLPLSLNLSSTVSRTHWAAIEEGAARSGRTPRRADWRIEREVFVADTDAEAERWCLQGNMGRMMREYFLPLFDSFQMLDVWKDDPSVADSDVTPEWLVHHGWLVGSVETVAEKLEKMYTDVGGFGTLLMLAFDYSDNPGPWRYSMELLTQQVLPKVAHLIPEAAAAD